MKTILNPFENAKRTAQGTGGGVSPAVIEKMQAEISVLGSQNKTQAQDITDIKGSLNSISDKLNAISETYTILYASLEETSETTVEISSHVDDYKFILVCQKFISGYRNVSLIPRALFEKSSDLWISSLDTNTYAICRYVDNTHISVRSVGGGIAVFGIK